MADPRRLETILAEVAALRDRGEGVDATAILAAHPDLGEPLRDALAALDLLDLSLVGESATGPYVPEVVGPYRVTSRLGSGGMGTVYLAETRSAVAGCEPGECVALKVVHPHLLERPGFFKRFLREAEAGKRVEHPHVVRTLDADAVRAGGDTVHFLVMEYVQGQTLADLLEELGVVPETLLREIARQMADGLSAIHEAGLVHRDLKPENALITSDQVVQLMDLGVARPLASEDNLTQQGAFAGSLPYAAPEQFGDGDVTASSDLYSLGVTLFELATGSSPFRRDGFAAVMAAHREHVPPSVREVVPEMSPFFSDVVATLLAKQPGGRFASASELVAVLTDGERSDWWIARERSRPRDVARTRVPVRRDTALHGREHDLTLLRAAFDASRAGDGRMLLLEGEAGIGKSRLVDAFLSDLEQADVHVLYGSYPPTGGMGGVSDAITEHFGTHSLEEALLPYLTVTPALVPGFAALIRHEPPPEGAAPITSDALHAVLVHLMRALAAEKPLVWVIEDLHFADEDSRAAVLSLARALENHRVLLLGTTRPGLPDDWLAHVARTEHLVRQPVGRLSAREVALLLQDAFKSDALAERLGVKIALKSDGVPFFVFEMIRGLREGQFLTQMPDGTWAETKVVEQIEVPSAVRDLIEVRLRDLPSEKRALLDLGAVQGFTFDPDLIARVLERRRVGVLQDLADLERRSGVVHGERGSCRFDHHQLQEVLYESLPPDLRVEYHAALAAALETRSAAADSDPGTLAGMLCVDLAEHYLKGARGESALRYLAVAQTHLSAAYQHARVVALTEQALAAPDVLTGAERAEALLRLAAALDQMGRRARQEECVREAERLAADAGDDELRGRVASALGIRFLRTTRHTEAEVAFRHALELALARGDQAAEASATVNLGLVFHAEGRPREARAHHERGLALSREIRHRQFEANATGNLGTALASGGRLREAGEHYQRQLALVREIGDWVGESRATGNLGVVFLHEGLLREAREHFERHLALSREVGNRVGEAIAHHNLAEVLREEGEDAPAEERLLLCLRLGEETDYGHLTAATHRALGSLRAEACNAASGLGSLAAARDIAAENGFAGVLTLACCELACLPGGDAADALAAFAENGDSLDAEERREARWLLFRASGDRAHLEEAKRLLDESMAHVDDETRTSMLTNLRINRAIMAAWNEHFGGDRAGQGSESPTRAG